MSFGTVFKNLVNGGSRYLYNDYDNESDKSESIGATSDVSNEDRTEEEDRTENEVKSSDLDLTENDYSDDVYSDANKSDLSDASDLSDDENDNTTKNTKLYSKQDINKFVKNKPLAFVIIYADWCGHCKSMIADLRKMGKFKNTDTVWFIEEQQAVPEIKDHFPHIYKYVNGKSSDITPQEFYKFLDDKVNKTTPNKQFDRAAMNKFFKGKSEAFVVLYGDACGHCISMKSNLQKKNKFKNSDTVLFVESKNIADELRDYVPHIYKYKNGKISNTTQADLFKYLKA